MEITRIYRYLIVVILISVASVSCNYFDSDKSAVLPVQMSPNSEERVHVKDVVAHDYYSFAILSDSSLWGWGLGITVSYSMLSNPLAMAPDLSPVRISDGVASIKFIRHGSDYGYIIKADGGLWTFNNLEDLLDGKMHKIMDNVSNAAVSHPGVSLALSNDGVVWKFDWLINDNPEPIMSDVTDIASIPGFALALKSDGSVWILKAISDERGIYKLDTPKQIIASERQIVDIFSDFEALFAVSSDDTLWGWGGLTRYGLISSSGNMIQDTEVPVCINDYTKCIYSINMINEIKNDSSYFMLKNDGVLWSKGSNSFGRLGIGINEDNASYSKVASDVVKLSLGEYHALALLNTGEIMSWGSNAYGELGRQGVGNSFTWELILPEIITISSSRYDTGRVDMPSEPHCLTIDAVGTVWAWGGNNMGQLGDGTYERSIVPIPIMSNATRIACGRFASYAVKEDGTLWQWGATDYSDQSSAVCVPQLVMEGVIDVYAHDLYHLILKEDGTLWGKGLNKHGRIGVGWEENIVEYAMIMDNVKSVSISSSHCLAIRNDNSLWGWGSNEWGQLGSENGFAHTDLSTFYSPIKLLDNVVAVAAGGSSSNAGSMGHSMAITTGGELYVWGANTGRQLVSSADQIISAPTRIDGNYIGIAAGISTGAAIDSFGTMVIRGMTVYSSFPGGVIAEVSDVRQAVIGQTAFYAIKNDGTLWCWGYNVAGELGVGIEPYAIKPGSIISKFESR